MATELPDTEAREAPAAHPARSWPAPAPHRPRHGGAGVGGSIVRSRGRSPTVQRSTLYRVPTPTPLQ